MFQKSVLILVVLLYLYEVQRTKKVTSKDAAMLLFFAYQLYQTFFLRVEHLSAADGFTTDIDKEAYTNLHKIVSELYKNDTLTIPGHLHVKGNLHVGDKAPSAGGGFNGPLSGCTHIQNNLQVGSRGDVKGAPAGEGVIYTDWLKGRVLASNEKIDKDRIDIRSDTWCDVHADLINHRNTALYGTLGVNKWAHFKNRVKMSWIPDNSKQGKRIQEKGELFRDGWNVKVHH